MSLYQKMQQIQRSRWLSVITCSGTILSTYLGKHCFWVVEVVGDHVLDVHQIALRDTDSLQDVCPGGHLKDIFPEL